MKRIGTIIATALVALTMTFAAAPVYAACPTGNDVTGAGAAGGADCADKDGGSGAALPAIITNLINVALFIIGAIAVVMLIYGGVKYTTSAGDSAKITSAKNTIMYSIVGLVVAILAFAIVNFVITNIK